MNIGGLQKFSLIDYPGKICAIVFTQGCNFTCVYCHNPELVYPDLFGTCITESTVLKFLEKRRGRLDAVTVTGGEPLLQPEVVDFLFRLKSLGFLVKIDTNGSLPDVLSSLIHRRVVDYVAMDVKAPLDKYEALTHHSACRDSISESIRIIKESPLPYEFRTTVVRNFLTLNDILEIGNLIKGTHRYVLQKYVPSRSPRAHPDCQGTFTDDQFLAAQHSLEPLVQSVLIR
jgi:pyruvate formate lyase activating enzyme